MLEEILNNHVSGATEIAIRCAEYLKVQANQIPTDDPETFCSKLSHVGEQLKAAQPAMAPVFNAVHSVLSPLTASLNAGASLTQLREAAISASQSFIERMRCSLQDLTTFGVKLFDHEQSIMTYSSSQAVAAILKGAKTEGKSLHVIVPESRPMCEGRLLARDLGSVGIPCTLIVDGAISMFLNQVDRVLVGADRVSEEFVINKTGTKALLLMAKESHLPVSCACETSKFLRSDLLPFLQKEMPPEEVWETTPKNVTVRNLYFEQIPLDLFKNFATDKGILSVEEVKELMRSDSR